MEYHCIYFVHPEYFVLYKDSTDLFIFSQYQSSNWDIKHQLKCFRYCVCSKRDSCFQTHRLVLRLALDTFGRYRGDVSFYFCILIKNFEGRVNRRNDFRSVFQFSKSNTCKCVVYRQCFG